MWHGPVMFPYSFTKKYKPNNILVFYDDNCGLNYVLYENKRMYFPRDWDKCSIQSYYSFLLAEQDASSPHLYLTDNFQVQPCDVVVDVGTAEGNFALSVVEKAKKLYLFETEKQWLKPLKETFAPWRDKVVIVNKYVSDQTKNNCVKLDDFFKAGKINFLKADIEGAELQMLDGAEHLLAAAKNLKIVLCTYHKQRDAELFKKILTASGFQTEFSKGYMIVPLEFAPPYLRRGLIRAVK
ncbi:MAG: FkbM family methyltransferase [Candidatus Margulisbacteria bacterium]|jgi:hypothetical protein|nr:FkbM family methyltransferase [Candidatus Margulisiibacteriota bacterium]